MKLSRRAGQLALAVLTLVPAAGGTLLAQEPSIRIVAPTPDQAVAGPTLFTVEAKAAAGRRLAQVTLFVDGHPVAQLTAPPWQAIFDAGDDLHPHTLRAVAQDDAGNVASDLSTTLYIGFVEEVVVPGRRVTRQTTLVSVLDRQRNPMPDLKPEEFRLKLGGRPEPILAAGMEQQPLAVEILLDVSGTTYPHWPTISAAADGFLALLDPEDGAEVLVFAGNVGRLAAYSHDHQASRERVLLMKNLAGVPGFSMAGTVLYDALAAGIEEINRNPGARSLVVLTDARDMGSLLTYRQVADVVRSAGMRLDVVRFGRRPAVEWSEATRLVKRMRRLAQDSGGREWVVRDVEDVPMTFGRLARELKARYRLEFAPEPKPGAPSRKVSMTVAVSRPGARVLAAETLVMAPAAASPPSP